MISPKRWQPCGDVYVNDAFGTAHRAEATTYGIARYAPVAVAGPLLAAELDALEKALKSPLRPMMAIVGGSKVSGKLEVLKTLADKVDSLIVGGGIANTFLLAAGYPVGRSLIEEDLIDEAKSIMAKMKYRKATVPLPVDVVTAKEFAASAPAVVKKVADVEPDDMILDIGPETAKLYADRIAKSGTIVWNGPVGVFDSISLQAVRRPLPRRLPIHGLFRLQVAGTRWLLSPNTILPTKWGISRLAVALFWNSWKGKPCLLSKS